LLRPSLLVEAQVQLLLLLWLASCPQAVIAILGIFMLLITVIVVCAQSSHLVPAASTEPH